MGMYLQNYSPYSSNFFLCKWIINISLNIISRAAAFDLDFKLFGKKLEMFPQELFPFAVFPSMSFYSDFRNSVPG